jgi:hypothetical protein
MGDNNHDHVTSITSMTPAASAPGATLNLKEARPQVAEVSPPRAAEVLGSSIPEASEVVAEVRKPASEEDRNLPNPTAEVEVQTSEVIGSEQSEASEVLAPTAEAAEQVPWAIHIIREGREEKINRVELDWLLEEHTLSPHQVARMTEDAGVRRSTRSIQDWCKPNAEGITRLQSFLWVEQNRYYINEASAIAEVRRLVIVNGRNYADDLPRVTAEGDLEFGKELPKSAPETSEAIRNQAAEGSAESRKSTAEAAEQTRKQGTEGSEELRNSASDPAEENEEGDPAVQARKLFKSGKWMSERNPEALQGLILKLGLSLTDADARVEQLNQAQITLLGVIEGNADLYKEVSARFLAKPLQAGDSQGHREALYETADNSENR